MRLYTIEGIRYVRVVVYHSRNQNFANTYFTAVDRADYLRLYRLAVQCRRDHGPAVEPPVLPQEQLDVIWKNTINYLDRENLRLIRSYGGRAKRGMLLTGPPGNGKTSVCRWLWQECKQRNWEWRLVTADAYAQARGSCEPEDAVKALFTVGKHGIIFFDDMDMALRDRDKVRETDDQSVFLNALDGMEVKEGVAFVFTTNCPLDLIDRAFKRPGRIDVVMNIGLPTAGLRCRLVRRWHADIQSAIDIDHVAETTRGFSFAEMDEVKNLMIQQFLEDGCWDWDRSLQQFKINRQELTSSGRLAGFQGLIGSPAGSGPL